MCCEGGIASNCPKAACSVSCIVPSALGPGDGLLQAAWEREAAELVGGQGWSEMRRVSACPMGLKQPVQAQTPFASGASFRYSSSIKSLSNKFVHLTSYGVNKKNTEYKSNSDETACQGHKW